MLEKSRIFAVRRKICLKNKLRGAFVLLIGFCLLTPGVMADEQTLPSLGYRLNALSKPIDAPDFNLQDMDENNYSLKDFRGKVLLVNFWATWCPPCRREMPSMERLYQKLKDSDFTVIAINQFEDPDHVFAYIGQLGTDPTFPILFDRESKISEAYKVAGLPTTYLVDKKGKIRYRAVGGREFDHPEVEKIIHALIAED